jgi:asparagine synthase (glutamine-hydrolysing)
MPIKLFGYAGTWPEGAARDRLQHASTLAGSGRSAAVLPARDGFGGFLSGEFIETDAGAAVALVGAPDWIAADEPAAHPNPASRILAAYRRHGPQFVERMRGRFAMALVDTASRTVVLALDPMGMERLTYSASDAGLVFSDSASAVGRFPGVDGSLRPQSVYDYLLLHIVAAPDSIYRGVSKLRPGVAATYHDGRLTTRRYWQPAFVEHGAQSFGELKHELQSSIERAVRAENPGDASGAFLSGGLDSSSVAGMLSKVQAGNARTFSMGFGVDAYDELAYARIASRHFGVRGCEYHVTPEDIVDAFPRIAAAYDEPFGNSSAVPTYVCARTAAEHGVTHLLAGDGGDELFGGNERYVRQRVFERYLALPAALRAGIIEPLARCISTESRIAPLRKVRSYVDQARIRLPERLETWNLMYREGPVNILDDDFRSMIDRRAPFQRMQEVFDEIPDASLLNRMLFYDWHYTLSDNDLRKVGAMCELAGVRVSYPMLHSGVVDVSLRVPSALKIEGLELRSFYKRAMTDFLPEQILRKEKHGFGLPFGVWLKTHRGLAELIFAHLDSLRRRRIVRPAFIDDIVSRHRSGDASFYGYPLWDMAMLDAWLTAHGVTP